MDNKQQLIDKLIKTPGTFSESELAELFACPTFSANDLRPMFLRLFDLNDSGIRNDSEANKGMLGKLNKRSRNKRNQLFWKRIKKNQCSKVILAEGDSWFEYPLFIEDVIDQLNKREQYAIYSLAYGGDWIANILYEEEYIEALSLIKPDVFLISGGGNDIVGDFRLAQLVEKRQDIEKDIPSEIDFSSEQGRLNFANLCVNNEFHSLLKLFGLQYRLLFRSINKNPEKFQNMKIITQGYDYAIPNLTNGWSLLKRFAGNGKWLETPLLLRGYREKEEQKAIIWGMIHAFNEMLIKVGREFENVYHIDCRGCVNEKEGWADELHPKSKEFEKIAAVFVKCIESSNTDKKVYKVIDEM